MMIENKHWVEIAVDKFNRLVEDGPIPGGLQKPDPWRYIKTSLNNMPASLNYEIGTELPEAVRQRCNYDRMRHRLFFLKLHNGPYERQFLLEILIEGIFNRQLDEDNKLIDEFHREIIR